MFDHRFERMETPLDYDYHSESTPYVSARQRRKRAEQKRRELEQDGHQLHPVSASANGPIARSVWGKAWCQHLSHYQDLDYRLDRGRSYLRQGAVLNLELSGSQVVALVLGKELYNIELTIAPMASARWHQFISATAGSVHSVLELISGALPTTVTNRIADPASGLFPEPEELQISCNCLDYAKLCKHAAAVLYGIGVLVDSAPERFFTLRQVNPADLLEAGRQSLATPGKAPGLDSDNLGEMFDIELGDLH